jgi:hypothetical protein
MRNKTNFTFLGRIVDSNEHVIFIKGEVALHLRRTLIWKDVGERGKEREKGKGDRRGEGGGKGERREGRRGPYNFSHKNESIQEPQNNFVRVNFYLF